jgi:hypothetical protein
VILALGSTALARKPVKDRGDASMNLGGYAWTGTLASARIKGGTLAIHASRSDYKNGVSSRQEIQLEIDGFKGPGSYTVSMTGSRFIAVGFDTKGMQSASDDEAEKRAIDALRNARHLSLVGATVTIDAVTDDTITGTFEWKNNTGNQPAITDGKFRALIKKSN